MGVFNTINRLLTISSPYVVETELSWDENDPGIQRLVLALGSAKLNMVAFCWFRNSPTTDLPVDEPARMQMDREHLIQNTFPPETVFSGGSDVEFSFRGVSKAMSHWSLRCRGFVPVVTDLGLCSYSLVSMYRIVDGQGQWSGDWEGMDIQFNTSPSDHSFGVTWSIRSAQERHTGIYECSHSSYSEEQGVLIGSSTHLVSEPGLQLPVSILLTTGHNLLHGSDGHITHGQATISAGIKNAMSCTITPVNQLQEVDLYKDGIHVEIAIPMPTGDTMLNSITYVYRLRVVTSADAGEYTWRVVGKTGEVWEKTVSVSVQWQNKDGSFTIGDATLPAIDGATILGAVSI